MEELACVRTFPGIPDPDGPDEWMDITGRVMNPHTAQVELAKIAAVTVRVFNEQNGLVITVKGPMPVTLLDAGQTYQFDLRHDDSPLPDAASCAVAFTGADGNALPLEGMTEAEVTVLPLP